METNYLQLVDSPRVVGKAKAHLITKSELESLIERQLNENEGWTYEFDIMNSEVLTRISQFFTTKPDVRRYYFNRTIVRTQD